MKIVIIGGTGLIGSQATTLLKDQHEVIVASPNTGVNTLTGEGLDEALVNANVVIDVSNAPSFADEDVMHFFKTSSQNLLKATKKAGVQHLIALSVVGTSKLQESGYFRAKQVQEDHIRNSDTPYTIVQATQFYEFAGGIAAMSTVDGKIRLSGSFIQPIASAEVAAFVTSRVSEKPEMGTLEIGGPKKWPINEWIGYYLSKKNDPTQVEKEATPTYSGAPIEPDTLVAQNAFTLGKISYDDWISIPGNLR
ncbi:SDR family oxidoreductase [Flavobacterium sp.]|uniref:SDR family oxidoreductase n=1 Tax=Flavobacterium sp. TaxID=239 RepID=UPI0039E63A3E